jgi:hypothetical protein
MVMYRFRRWRIKGTSLCEIKGICVPVRIPTKHCIFQYTPLTLMHWMILYSVDKIRYITWKRTIMSRIDCVRVCVCWSVSTLVLVSILSCPNTCRILYGAAAPDYLYLFCIIKSWIVTLIRISESSKSARIWYYHDVVGRTSNQWIAIFYHDCT